MAEQTFNLPDLGEGLTEAEVVEWLVADGDDVLVDQHVVVVETAKATVEVPCPYAGKVSRRHGSEGEVVAVGAPLVTVTQGVSGDASGDSAAGGSPAGDGSAAAPGAAPDGAASGDASGDSGSGDSGSGAVLIGYGTAADSAAPSGGRRAARAARRTARGTATRPPSPAPAPPAPAPGGPAPAPAPEQPPVTAPSATDAPIAPSLGEEAVSRGKDAGAGVDWGAGVDTGTGAGGAAASPKVISPIVRKLAADRGIDLRSVRPGPGGVIRRADVDAVDPVDAADARGVNAASAPAAGGVNAAGVDASSVHAAGATSLAAAAGAAPVIPAEGDERVPLTGIRRIVAEKLSQSRREIPDATTWVDVDATGLVGARRAIGLERAGILALLGRICVAALHRFPELNSSVDTERGEIVRHRAVHLGFAADSPRGLVVPVIHDTDRLTTRELASRMVELIDSAREGTLKPADLTGGTFTLNNYGVFGVDGSTPIINHPEAAMLGVGRIIDRPWVVDGELTVRKVAQLGLSFDHRVCDGGVAGGFLRFVADAVEQPLQLLGDV
ncbi:2-oxo acid dehydrogenase subunit E2 [Flexivirga sp. ID2601S]|uniref:Dihydrolipoamide acetyltransferase component of pyruvate dehydrogenase complex n=1 Tax=Flexivirga aerilata TaxID=1656889 RepID=A0A849AEA9_9MICO|nr:dihydrolipoamide acetyltransferase family protein [Flexivirga aerilata]NNG38133.1 2-oxo acid dehydrogenase subunit E2 [Flexivirga aerilata]